MWGRDVYIVVKEKYLTSVSESARRTERNSSLLYTLERHY